MENNNSVAALQVIDLKVHFPIRQGVFGKVTGQVKAVDGISFDVRPGEVFALVGESGCGKTTAAKAVLGLEHITAGDVKLGLGPWKRKSVSWPELGAADRRKLRRHIQIVFQDPASSLDPRMTVRQIIEEPLALHGVDNRDTRLRDLLDQVGLSPSYLERYPHEFSGGQQQRIGIARALATGPEMIIADEPVSALDVSIQAQIINLLDDLRRQYNQSLLFISHDLAVVRHVARRMAVMYLGRIMETGTEKQIYGNPQHPYTHTLLESVPVPGKGRTSKRNLPPEEKSLGDAEKGCPFYPRCKERASQCREGAPSLKDIGEGHLVACIRR
ncbi:MAG: ATP-binding cassette domain-containing protein [Chitinivibrionales bacterium]|nr:ATP-binding cassette domain-containing protein [Chitinivibrionales bacterium]MBD3396064.1 ATP-binding cassette domain-containing protein [Chitinivibrionales bacterium]